MVAITVVAAALVYLTWMTVRLRRQAATTTRLLRQAEQAAHSAEREPLVEHVTDVILVVDEAGTIRYASPSALTVFATSTLDDVPLLDLVEPAERRQAESLLQYARSGHPHAPPSASRGDWTALARDGRKVRVEVTCRSLRAGRSASGAVVTLRDVTAQRALEHELTRRMFHDPLTGLPNRLMFAERVSQAVTADNLPAGVLLIDLDNFKTVNDGFGHQAGDAVLAEVGHRIRDITGDGGIAARLGDDEFAVLAPDTTVEQTEALSARISAGLTVPVSVGGDLVPCAASIGVATSTGTSAAPDLLRHADLALRAAKAAGRGTWRRYEPAMNDAVAHREATRMALSRALPDGALSIDYQPIVALASGHTVGYEALLRWQHPTRGRLSPADFIDLAEESGAIVPIGEWVLETAMGAATRWPAEHPSQPPYVSVNVSAAQFRTAGFVDSVDRLLAASGLPPHRLVLEMTERLLLRDEETVWEDLKRLRQRGVRVAIDDFGTGYSALSYLRHAPLDVVKLDRSFITPLAFSPRQRELVAGIVRLARSLDLDVVAEGIETEHQRQVATRIGCGYGQGYLLGRPLPEPATHLAPHAGRTGSQTT